MLRLVLPFNGHVKVPGRRFGDARRRLYDLRCINLRKFVGRRGASYHPNVQGQAALIHQVIPKAPEKGNAAGSYKK